jgi:hypothetical protein
MGVGTRMIAGVRACLTFAPDRSSSTIQPTPHYAEALSLHWIHGTSARWDGYLEFQRRPEPMLAWLETHMS